MGEPAPPEPPTVGVSGRTGDLTTTLRGERSGECGFSLGILQAIHRDGTRFDIAR